MQQTRLKEKIKDRSGFVLIVELTSGPDFSFVPIDGFLEAWKAAARLSSPKSKPDFLPIGFDFAGITSTDNSGGTPNIEPVSVLSHIKSKSLLGDLDFIPHISCKDKNSDSLVSSLAGFKAMDVEALLVVTGDKPVKGKGVFELESINLLQLIKKLNADEYLKTSPEALENVHQFFAGAAVSPFKYTEASQMQQYYKMAKKIACGAKFLITQVGWDWKKSVELFRYLRENNIDIPVIGNAYLVSTTNPSVRLMHDLKLPGCFVSDEFLAKLTSENYDDHIERCAQQIAMYKSIGAAGVDIGSVHDFDVFIRIIQRASEIGDNWEQYKDNLCWPKKDGFYLYGESGKRAGLSKQKKKFKHKFFDTMHKHLFEPQSAGFRAAGKVMSLAGAKKNKGFVYNSFAAFEYAFKHALFECDMCGDCYLPENFSLCTIGGCEKGLSNAPCGDATVAGLCGNNLDIVCIGERIYNAAASVPGGIEKLQSLVNNPRIFSLEQTSSILNDWFGRDHNAKQPFIAIGDLINSSIPKTGKIMKQLLDAGRDAFSKPSDSLNYMIAMLESQAAAGADYIAVNLDAFIKTSLQQAGVEGVPPSFKSLRGQDARDTVDMMSEYIRLVQELGCNTPICIDSVDNKVLIEGLKKWYGSNSNVRPPLLSSIKQDRMDEIFAMRKDYDFAVAVLLNDDLNHAGLNRKESIEQLYLAAQKIFEKSVVSYGFRPQQVFLELQAQPLFIDLQKSDNACKSTHVIFEIVKKITSDRKMKGVHCLIRPAIVCNKLKRGLGITRAYFSRALNYGFDSAFVNVTQQFGKIEPDAELLKVVDVFINMDGSAESRDFAAAQLKDFVKD